METTTGAFNSQQVVAKPKRDPHADVVLVSTIRLEIAYVDARADSRTTMVKDVRDRQGFVSSKFFVLVCIVK